MAVIHKFVVDLASNRFEFLDESKLHRSMSGGGRKELKFEEARLATFRAWPANAKVNT